MSDLRGQERWRGEAEDGRSLGVYLVTASDDDEGTIPLNVREFIGGCHLHGFAFNVRGLGYDGRA